VRIDRWKRTGRVCLASLSFPFPSQGTGLRILSDAEVDSIVKEIEEEKAAAEAAKRGGPAGAGAERGSSS